MITGETAWRSVGDVSADLWRAVIETAGGPLELASVEAWEAVRPHSALALAMLRQESSYATDFDANPASSRNPWNLKHTSAYPWRGYETYPSENGYTVFPSWIEGAAGWKSRVTSGQEYKNGIYAKTESIADLIRVYAPAYDQTKTTTQAYIDGVVRSLNSWKLAIAANGEGDQNMPEGATFGRVPMYGYEDRRVRVQNKPEGVGWNNLGRRRPKFIVLHRMLGTLLGTDGYFANPSVGALTDFGIGVRDIDGNRAGHIYQWVDPTGHVSGWASGRVSAPYGDGKRIVEKYGINAVNRDGVSVEISGFAETQIDDFAWQEIVHLCAWWIDFMKSPYHALPLNPHTGINVLVFHQEFTIGTGKECPYNVVMARIDELYRDIAGFLEPYQSDESGGDEVEPDPEPVPPAQYAPPAPIGELAMLADDDADRVEAVLTDEGRDFVFVGDRVRAIRTTPRLQYAFGDAERIGPDIEAGDEFEVRWMIGAGDGKHYYITPWWTRVLVADTERVRDAA